MPGQKRDREGGEGRPDGRHSRIDKETLNYIAEIDTHFKSMTDDEDRQLLAGNVLGDAAGREADLATDAACSRVLEALLPFASNEALCTFTKACVEGENLGTMCTSGPFGSHVLEKCILALSTRAALAGDDDFKQIEEALTAVTEAAAGALYELSTSKYGSFVARRLLCVLSGRDVAPSAPAKKQAPAPDAATGVAAAGGDRGGGSGPGGPSSGAGRLASKLGGAGAGGDAAAAMQSAAYPELVEKLAAAVLSDDWTGEEMQRLSVDSFAGPVLQSLLRACTHNQKLHQRLLLQVLGGANSKGVESVSMDRCHALMQDRNGSHLMEAVFQTAPDDYFAKLSTLCFKGHLLPLAQHSAANFAVQAAISALRKPQQLKRMVEDLRPSFHQLLRSRRSGVIAAVLAAAGRLGTCEAEAAAALWAAAGEGSSSGPPLAALLTLDTTTQLGNGGRLSTLGCAMLMTLLRLPPAACKQWADAVGALPPRQLQHVAKDPGGCRVLEAYLEGPGAPAKKRRSLLQGLSGAYGEVAMGGSGSHFVEKCYALADVAEKETIAAELAAAEPRLVATHRGPLLLRRCHVDAYKKGSEGWQQRVVAADAARREFEDLFGEGEAAGGAAAAAADAASQGAAAGAEAEEGGAGEAEGGGKAKKAKKGKKAAAAAAAVAAAEEGEQQAAGGGKKAMKKKKKKKQQQQLEAEAAAADEQQQAEEEGEQQPPGGGIGGKAKKPKRAAEAQGPAAVDDIMAQLGFPAGAPKKKKKKSKEQ